MRAPRPKGKPRRDRPPLRSGTIEVGEFQSLAHERLLGRLTMKWALVENALQLLIWELLNLSTSDGRIVTARLDALALVEMFRVLALRHFKPEFLQGVLDLLTDVQDCRDDRNALVHGTWTTVPAGEELGLPQRVAAVMSLRPKGDPGRVMIETFPLRRMHAIVSDAEECRARLIALAEQLRASRDKLLQQHPPD